MAQHKWHKEIKAWADGAEIMCKKPNGDWVIVEQPKWIELDEYRIKPQTMFNGLTEEESNNTASVKGLTQPKEPQCNLHPKAPHGFNRDASHNSGNYVCDCEGWDAWQDGYDEGLRKGLELEQPKKPQYLYVYGDMEWDTHSYKLTRREGNYGQYIGKIKLETEE